MKSSLGYYKRGKTWTYHLAWLEGGKRQQKSEGRVQDQGRRRPRRGSRSGPVSVDGFTGLRRGEACGLRWSDVDLDAGAIQVARTLRQVGAEVHEGTTKTEGSARTVEIDAATVAVLRSWRARQAELHLLVGAAGTTRARCSAPPTHGRFLPTRSRRHGHVWWPTPPCRRSAATTCAIPTPPTSSRCTPTTGRSPTASDTPIPRSRCAPTPTRWPAPGAAMPRRSRRSSELLPAPC